MPTDLSRSGARRRGPDLVHYRNIDAIEIDNDGALRLYRRRGLFGLLRRQDVYHPVEEWKSVYLNDLYTAKVELPPLPRERTVGDRIKDATPGVFDD